MNREEFEEWLEDHKDDAVQNIDAQALTLRGWIRYLSLQLRAFADDHPTDTEDAADDEEVDDEFAPLENDEEAT